MAIARRDAKPAPAPAPAKAPTEKDPFESPEFVAASKFELRPPLKEAEPIIKGFAAQIKKASKDVEELSKIGIAISAYQADNENKLSKGQFEALD